MPSEVCAGSRLRRPRPFSPSLHVAIVVVRSPAWSLFREAAERLALPVVVAPAPRPSLSDRTRGPASAALPGKVSSPEVLDEMSGVDVLSRGAVDQFVGRIAASPSPDVFFQPSVEGDETALFQLQEEIGRSALGGGEQLSRHQGTERVEREIAERSHWPVHVLHAAISVVACRR